MCHNKRVFETLIQEVGEWSAKNFGTQISKWPPLLSHPYIGAVLDHVAPLLGIVEEIGELEEAIKADNPELIRDSIGDTQIYLADYLYRTGLPVETINWDRLSHQEGNTVFLSREKLIFIGKLVHANLKRHQGIRDYAGEKFLDEVSVALTDLMILLRLTYVTTHPKKSDGLEITPYTPQEGTDTIITIASNTWLHVQQRNWKADPSKGGT